VERKATGHRKRLNCARFHDIARAAAQPAQRIDCINAVHATKRCLETAKMVCAGLSRTTGRSRYDLDSGSIWRGMLRFCAIELLKAAVGGPPSLRSDFSRDFCRRGQAMGKAGFQDIATSSVGRGSSAIAACFQNEGLLHGRIQRRQSGYACMRQV